MPGLRELVWGELVWSELVWGDLARGVGLGEI